MVVPFVAGLGRGGPFPGLVGLRAWRRAWCAAYQVTILPQRTSRRSPGRAARAQAAAARGSAQRA